MMSKGVVVVHEDGTFELAPMQVWRNNKGSTVIRLGRNTFFFNEDGTYDGSEHKAGPFPAESPEAKAITEALEVAGKSKGLAPEDPYYQPGTPGWQRETQAWANAKADPMTGETYLTNASKPKAN